MRIQSTNHQHTHPNFKSAYPVVHWVRETNGSFAPVANMQIVKTLQGKLIRALNKPLVSSQKPMKQVEQNARAYIGSCDVDYRNKPCVRSFYNRTENNIYPYTPVSFIISGKDVESFENNLSKDIGRAKGKAKDLLNNLTSIETQEALRVYNQGGLNFVKNNNRQIKDRNGIPYILHTKFEIIRNKFGKIKDYKFLDVRFLPSKGPGNPLERL